MYDMDVKRTKDGNMDDGKREQGTFHNDTLHGSESLRTLTKHEGWRTPDGAVTCVGDVIETKS